MGNGYVKRWLMVKFQFPYLQAGTVNQKITVQ